MRQMSEADDTHPGAPAEKYGLSLLQDGQIAPHNGDAPKMNAFGAETFIQKKKNGTLNRRESLRLANEMSLLATINNNRPILLDIKETDIQVDMHSLVEAAAECGLRMIDFPEKIAVVLPQCEDKQNQAERFKACMRVQAFLYEHFYSREEAIRWLKK